MTTDSRGSGRPQDKASRCVAYVRAVVSNDEQGYAGAAELSAVRTLQTSLATFTFLHAY
jgi:hypothetical protein